MDFHELLENAAAKTAVGLFTVTTGPRTIDFE
jgi:hypothetical protein